jgi:outer membrane PBP1 activator LpoA protein
MNFSTILPIIIAASLLVSGCTKPRTSIKHLATKQHPLVLSKESQKYLKLANNTDDAKEKNQLLLQSAELLIQANNPLEAEKILNALDDLKLTPSQHATWQILLAKISLLRSNLLQAKSLLANISSYQRLETYVYKNLHATRYEIFLQSQELLEAIQEQIHLEKFLADEEELLANRKSIWENLQQLTPSFLRLANQDSFSPTMQGWLQIAYIAKQYDAEQDELLRSVIVWKKHFPNHPANELLDLSPANVAQHNDYNHQDNKQQAALIKDKFKKINKIALMLPLSGPHQKSATAIKNGFLAASYNKKSTTKKPEIIIIDTNEYKINHAYKQATDKGADLIIGPLIKEDLEVLARSNKLTIPIIGLNNIGYKSSYSNLLFQFGLSPEIESTTIVEKALENHHQNALFLIQKNDLGKRMLKSITTAWQAAGGNVVDVINFDNNTDINKDIRTALGIEDSNLRAKNLSKLGIKFNFDPRRRQDIDCVFLISNQANARQIKPLLNFYYASKIPVYASSNIYNGNFNQSLDRDLDGIQFCDIPWILDKSIANRTIYQDIKSLWKENFSQYKRLYALGIDAYKLSTQMPQLLAMPELGVSGMTGILKLDNNIINRKLMWGTFQNGTATMVNQKNN